MKFYRPLPLDKELKVNPRLLIISKTDTEGNILYINKNFIKLAAYSKEELHDAPHSIIRHPDMPRVIFFLLWEELKQGKEVTILMKNLAKTGEYYWLQNKFKIVTNDITHQATYMATGEMASIRAIEQIEKLYQRLLKIEKRENLAASLFYLESYLQERNMTLNSYMNEILKPQTTMGSLLTKIKNGLSIAA